MRIVVVMCFILFVLGCGNDAITKEAAVENEIPLEEQIETMIQKEMASGTEKDTIVLDFVFGMSKMDVYRHTKALAKKDKMYPIQKSKRVREYVYDLRLRKAGKLRTFFEAFYFEDKIAKTEELYKVECIPQIDTSLLDVVEVVDEIKPIFEQEYGPYDFIVPDKEDPEAKTYLWITGNQKIELGCFKDKVFMYYTDVPIERRAIKASDL